jgi:hypothetical protein
MSHSLQIVLLTVSVAWLAICGWVSGLCRMAARGDGGDPGPHALIRNQRCKDATAALIGHSDLAPEFSGSSRSSSAGSRRRRVCQ